jgi:N-acetylated-alpha-linked acidic dipeptidase
VEQNAPAMQRVVAYFNTDVAVSGPEFSADAVPSLKQFLRELTRSVPSPLGGTVYQQWRANQSAQSGLRGYNATREAGEDVHVGDLGSGSDFAPFFEHAGVPSTDIGSNGSYGVYHSVFDNYAWYTMNADPNFAYLQQMARVFGLEALRMADADVLPYDYVAYADAIRSYLDAAKKKAGSDRSSSVGQNAGDSCLDFAPAQVAAARFAEAAKRARSQQIAATGDLVRLNLALRQTETALLSEAGLPNRPWFRHVIYAPGELTGYAAVVIPGVNEALDAKDRKLAAQQLAVLTEALMRAAQALESAR